MHHKKNRPLRVYFIAGENSGDFIGAKIIKSIKEMNVNEKKKILFSGVGGRQMKLEGVNSLFDFEQLNLMGFTEVLPHIFQLKKLIDITAQDVINKQIDILVTIDSPGFTFRVAEKVKISAPEIKLIHIVAPSVWAYRPGRAKKYGQIYDKLLTLFPFEPPYFTKYGLKAQCIGHPILEQRFYDKNLYFPEFKERVKSKERVKRNDNVKTIVITPGSRKGELSRHMPVIKKALNELSQSYKIKVIFVQPNELHRFYILGLLKDAKFKFTFSTDRLKSFALGDVALAKSGTNTIEIAASGTPMIVGYKLHSLTYIILRMLIKVKYASIINIIPDKEIIPEYIQSNFTASNLARGLGRLLSDPNKSKTQVVEARKILKTLGFNSSKVPSQKAARIILGI